MGVFFADYIIVKYRMQNIRVDRPSTAAFHIDYDPAMFVIFCPTNMWQVCYEGGW